MEVFAAVTAVMSDHSNGYNYYYCLNSVQILHVLLDL